MAQAEKRPLKVFLCHASGDKPPVRDLYKRLTAEGVDAWLDQEKLLPGQDWRLEIPRAVHEADVVVICLSKKSITKEGYVQKEIKFALDIAEEKPEGAIFLIPARLEECVVPERLSRWQWVDLYEENGFIKLLRSLKLRATAVGATVEPTPEAGSDQEFERRLEQLYTEGLAAFYTEDWEKACQRFQTILSEQPGHKNAGEKLAEAERQRSLARLYVQSTEAYKAGNWRSAIQSLDELTQKSPEYKDASQLLKNARKQRQLQDLYEEAKKLHAARKWEAVLKVFDQISGIDPAYPDMEGLLPSAQKEVAELKRQAVLNELYSRAVRAMDSGQWVEARLLLEQIHKSQVGFLETEQLLKKVEDQIEKVEEQNKRNEQINVLYEQAHGLLRSKKWRNALEKMAEIQKLDEQFRDKDEITEKAQAEIAREEQEAQKQNCLAALYAEAVRLLKEEKYQEAMDQWQEVKAADPQYPDRQGVQRTAKRKLAESAKLPQIKPRISVSQSLWGAIAGLVVVAGIVAWIVITGRNGQKATPGPTSVPTRAAIVNPPATAVPFKTSTPRPPTLIPTRSGYSDPTMYDDFNDPVFNGKINPDKWQYFGDIGTVSQENGLLKVTFNKLNALLTLSVKKNYNPVTFPIFVEAKMNLDPNSTHGGTDFGVGFSILDGWSNCSIFAGKDTQTVICWSHTFGEDQKNYEVNINPGTWHVLRVEMYPDTMTISYVVDGRKIGSYIPRNPNPLKNQFYGLRFYFHNYSDTAKTPAFFIDDVRIGNIGK